MHSSFAESVSSIITLQKLLLSLLEMFLPYKTLQKLFEFLPLLETFLLKITLQKVFLPLQTLKKCLLYYKLPQKVFLPLNTIHKAFLPFALCRNYLIHCRKGFFYYRLLIRKCFFYYTLSRNCLLTHSLQKLLLPLLKSSLHKMIKDTAKTFFFHNSQRRKCFFFLYRLQRRCFSHYVLRKKCLVHD